MQEVRSSPYQSVSDWSACRSSDSVTPWPALTDSLKAADYVLSLDSENCRQPYVATDVRGWLSLPLCHSFMIWSPTQHAVTALTIPLTAFDSLGCQQRASFFPPRGKPKRRRNEQSWRALTRLEVLSLFCASSALPTNQRA